MKLTKSVVKKLELPETGQRLIWDSELKGFGIRLTPSTRTYICQARVKDGKERRVSLGQHGVITADKARKKAQRELLKMLDGKDPVTVKKQKALKAITLKDVTDKYLKDRRELKQRSRTDILRHVTVSFAAWVDKPILSITRDKIAVKFQELSERSNAQANQAFRILRAIINYAMAAYRTGDKPMILENPVKILSDLKLWNTVTPRAGRIPTDKIGLAWNILQELRGTPEQTTTSRTVADIVSFLLLTGARWSEAAQLGWDRVNLDESWWYLPDPKNRNPVKFPLPNVLREILKARPKVNKYVFPGLGKKGYIGDPRSALAKINTAINAYVTPHDLRRTFRAIAGECHIELWRTKLLMNHRLSGDVTINSYTETSDLRYLSDEINKIGEWVLQQSLITSSEKVVPLKTAR